MLYFIGAVVLVVVIAVGGVLAYKNNQAKVDKGIADIKSAADLLKKK